jgi:hypothetical protein
MLIKLSTKSVAKFCYQRCALPVRMSIRGWRDLTMMLVDCSPADAAVPVVTAEAICELRRAVRSSPQDHE